MKASNPVRKLIESAKTFGVLGTFLRTLHRLRIASVCHAASFYMIENLESFKTDDEFRIKMKMFEKRFAGQMELKEITISDLELLKFEEGLHSLESMREHFEDGFRYFACLVDDKVIALNGVHPSAAFLTFIRIPYVRNSKGFIYMNHLITSSKFRNLGFGAVVHRYALQRMCGEGYKSVFSLIFPENSAAIQLHTRLGYKKWGNVTYVRVMNREFWFKTLTQLGEKYPGLLKDQRSSITAKQQLEAVIA